jgi:hypothetical protein
MANIVKTNKAKTTNITRSSSRRVMQTKIQEEIQKIDDEIEKLGVPNATFLCGPGALLFPAILPGTNTINITSFTDWKVTLMIYVHYNRIYDDLIVETKSLFNAKLNDPSSPPLTFPGSMQSFANVLHDLKLQTKLLYHKNRLTVLNAAKAKLTPFMDEESRLYSTLKEVEALYKTLK